jgi:hypothetical protein
MMGAHMARMYPTPLPEAVLADGSREAERKVYAALGARLAADYSVFYSVAWLSKAPGTAARDGEVDFVVAHPQRGALLLEVKGGRVARDGATGEWRSIDRFGGVHPIHDPFAQVRASKHALLHKLQEHPVLRKTFVSIGHGVVLPESRNPCQRLAPDAPLEITLFEDDLDRIDGRVDGLFEFWRPPVVGAPPASPQFLPALTQLLAPTFELRQPLLAPALDRDDRELLRLTEEQFGVLDLLARQRRVAVAGGAGTGKTVLALEKAKRLASEGLEVLLTCFNKPLAEHLRRSAGAVERLTIANFHELCWRMAHDAGVPLPDPASGPQPQAFFDDTLPDALLTALDRLPRRFDAIVVDEGQDFLETWWAPLQLCMTEPDGGILYVFHDDNQQVYRRAGSFPERMTEVVLRDNLRNTRRIHAATTRFYRGEPLRARGPEGRDVECVPAATQAAVVKAVSAILHRLVREEGVPPGDVAVLYGSSVEGPLKRGDRIGSFWTTTNQYDEPGKILLDSIRRFKGLERRVVILAGIDSLAPDDESSLLYVGLSRARTYLAVVASQATLERLGFAAGAGSRMG